MQPIPAVDDNDLLRYVRALVRRLWLVILIPVIAVGLGYVVIKATQPVQWTATAEIQVQQSVTANLLVNLSGGAAGSANNISDVLQIIQSTPVRKAVIASDPTYTLNTLPFAKPTQIASSNIVSVAVTDNRARQAALLANAYCNGYITYQANQLLSQVATASAGLKTQIAGFQAQIAALQTQVAQASPENRAFVQQTVSSSEGTLQNQVSTLTGKLAGLQAQPSLGAVNAQVVSVAATPHTPSGPRTKRDVAFLGAGALILVVAIVLLSELVDDRIRNSADVARAVPDIEVLGVFPAPRRRSAGIGVPTLAAASSPESEAFWALDAAVGELVGQEHVRSIMVAGPLGREDDDALAANLAVTMAKGGQSVLLVDFDLRDPHLHEMFGLDNTTGVADVLDGRADLGEVMHPVADVPGLHVVLAGGRPANATDLIGRASAASALAEMRRSAQVVILDASPVRLSPDAALLARMVDLSILVVRKDQTDRRDVSDSVGSLERAGAPLVTLVLQGGKRLSRGRSVERLRSEPMGRNGASADNRVVEVDQPAAQ